MMDYIKMKDRKFTIENLLRISTDFPIAEPEQKSFSFAGESEILRHPSHSLQVNHLKHMSDDLVTPQFISEAFNEKDDKVQESRYEHFDSNIQENVKVSKVKSKLCLNTLKINTCFQQTQEKTDANITQDSALYKENCRSLDVCGCILI